MDESTFRRLAPDAVAGRLDAETYWDWRNFARGNPERERFVVHVAEVAARIGGRHLPVRDVAVKERTPRRRPQLFWMLAPLFAGIGALGGILGMYSLLKSQASARAEPPQNNLILSDPGDTEQPGNPPGHEQPETDTPPPPGQPVEGRQVPPPQWDDTPYDPPDQPEPHPAALRLAAGDGTVRVRTREEEIWKTAQPGRGLRAGDRVAVLDGVATFESEAFTMHGRGRCEFELTGESIRFASGRFAVTVRSAAEFSAHNVAWGVDTGGFVVEPEHRGGSLLVVEGRADLTHRDLQRAVYAPVRVSLDSSLPSHPLTPDEIRQSDRELIGPHRVLLNWDCETASTTPALGERFAPGAFGDGHAIRRTLGQLAVGAQPGEELFAAVKDARLRMRIRTDAPRVRIESRVNLADGYRAVDAHIAIPRADEWVVVDVPLSILRAGRARSEPGWIPGRTYSAFSIAPEVDLKRPLLRRALAVDDLLVYAPVGR